MRNLLLCHWSSQLFDLRAPSSTDVPVLLLNQPKISEFRQQRFSATHVNRKWAFFFLICVDSTKFVLLNAFTRIKPVYSKIGSKSQLQSAKNSTSGWKCRCLNSLLCWQRWCCLWSQSVLTNGTPGSILQNYYTPLLTKQIGVRKKRLVLLNWMNKYWTMLLHGDKITDWRIKLELELELNNTFRYRLRAKRETRKWPRAWLMARDGSFARLAASPLPRACIALTKSAEEKERLLEV